MSAKKTEFKVGDRVAVYYASKRYVGAVWALRPDGMLNVLIDGKSDVDASIFPQQCRKLKPKKVPLRIEGECVWWMGRTAEGDSAIIPLNSPTEDQIQNSLKSFIGKRTKITVEVIDD